MRNLPTELLIEAEKRGQRTAFRMQLESGGYRSVTWVDYKNLTLRLSNYLKQQGVGPGDTVFLLAENSPEWTMATLAILNLGAILVPVASIASFLDLQGILKRANPKFCILSERCAASRNVAEEMQGKCGILKWDAFSTTSPLEKILQDIAPLPIDTSIPSDTRAILIFTSGTTGQPKGVPLTHKNLYTNAKDITEILPVTDRERVVSVLPLSHVFEFTGGFVLPALLGAEVTYVKSLKPEDLLTALKDSRATVMLGVPLLFEIIARNLQSKLDSLPAPLKKLFDYFGDLVAASPHLGPILFYPVHKALGGHLRFFMAGGSKLQPKTFQAFQRLGITVLQGYGLTETSPVLTVAALETAGPDHVGKAMRHVQIGIFDDQGKMKPQGEEGEVWAKGDSVFSGYLDAEHNKDVFFDGWFRTGDLGNLDARGILRITGRKKDIIVTSAGKNIYPEEIETVVQEAGCFLEVSVLGIPEASGHEKIVLVVVPDRSKFPGQKPNDIEKLCKAKATEKFRVLSEYKWPQKIEILYDELPKTITRKVKKHELRKQILAAVEGSIAKTEKNGARKLQLHVPLERVVGQGIEAIIGKSIDEILVTDQLNADLGLDSLTFVELVGSVEKEFSVKVDGVDFSTIQTVQDLIGILQFAADQSKAQKHFWNRFQRHVFFAEFTPADNQSVPWRVCRFFWNQLLRFYLRTRHDLVVEGLENLPKSGALIFTPNHSSHFDMMSIAAAVPPSYVHRTFAVAAKDYFFNHSWKAVIARIVANALPFDRKGRVNESMELCRQALAAGCSLTIFPEGTRSPDGKLQQFKTGVAQLLAGNPQARALPVYIEGAHEILPKGSKFPRAGKLTIRFGTPISFAQIPADPKNYQAIVDQIRTEVLRLSHYKLVEKK